MLPVAVTQSRAACALDTGAVAEVYIVATQWLAWFELCWFDDELDALILPRNIRGRRNLRGTNGVTPL